MLLNKKIFRTTNFKIKVDGTKSFQELINKAKFDWVNSDVNEKNFPIKIKTNRKVIVKLFHFNRYVLSQNIIREIKKSGYRLAFIEELIAFAISYPNLQKSFPIVALGSEWKQNKNKVVVPEIYWHGPGHSLSICGRDGGWEGFWRFVAIKENNNSSKFNKLTLTKN